MLQVTRNDMKQIVINYLVKKGMELKASSFKCHKKYLSNIGGPVNHKGVCSSVGKKNLSSGESFIFIEGKSFQLHGGLKNTPFLTHPILHGRHLTPFKEQKNKEKVEIFLFQRPLKGNRRGVRLHFGPYKGVNEAFCMKLFQSVVKVSLRGKVAGRGFTLTSYKGTRFWSAGGAFAFK